MAHNFTHIKFFSQISLAVLFFLSQTAFSFAFETNFWSKRRAERKSRIQSAEQIAQIPLPKPSPNPFFHSDPFPIVTSNLSETIQNKFPWLTPDLLRYATLQDTHISKNPEAPVVIHIQDVHDVVEAQKNIGHLLAKIQQKSEELLIGMEGAHGPFDVAPYRALPDQKYPHDIPNYFLEQGYFSGAEHLAITAPQPPLLWGVENESLYFQNIEFFRQSARRRSHMDQQRKTLTQQMEKQKIKVYSKKLLEFDRQSTSYENGDMGLGPFLSYLMTFSAAKEKGRYPNLQVFSKAFVLEKGLDFKEAEGERTDLLKILTKKMTKAELGTLLEQAQSHALGQMSFETFSQHLLSLCRTKKLSLAAFPQFHKYLAYRNQVGKMDPTDFQRELQSLRESAENSLIKTPEEKTLSQNNRWLHLLQKLTRQEMTLPEWNRFQKSTTAQSFFPAREELSLTPFEGFYRTALSRNDAMVENLLRKVRQQKTKRAVLIAGGFHTEGLKALLRKKDISHVVLAPKFRDIPEGPSSLELFARNPLPLEKLLAGEKIFLSPYRPTSQTAPHSFAQVVNLRYWFLKSLKNLQHHTSRTIEQFGQKLRGLSSLRVLKKAQDGFSFSLLNGKGQTRQFSAFLGSSQKESTIVENHSLSINGKTAPAILRSLVSSRPLERIFSKLSTFLSQIYLIWNQHSWLKFSSVAVLLVLTAVLTHQWGWFQVAGGAVLAGTLIVSPGNSSQPRQTLTPAQWAMKAGIRLGRPGEDSNYKPENHFSLETLTSSDKDLQEIVAFLNELERNGYNGATLLGRILLAAADQRLRPIFGEGVNEKAGVYQVLTTRDFVGPAPGQGLVTDFGLVRFFDGMMGTTIANGPLVFLRLLSGFMNLPPPVGLALEFTKETLDGNQISLKDVLQNASFVAQLEGDFRDQLQTLKNRRRDELNNLSSQNPDSIGAKKEIQWEPKLTQTLNRFIDFFQPPMALAFQILMEGTPSVPGWTLNLNDLNSANVRDFFRDPIQVSRASLNFEQQQKQLELSFEQSLSQLAGVPQGMPLQFSAVHWLALQILLKGATDLPRWNWERAPLSELKTDEPRLEAFKTAFEQAKANSSEKDTPFDFDEFIDTLSQKGLELANGDQELALHFEGQLIQAFTILSDHWEPTSGSASDFLNEGNNLQRLSNRFDEETGKMDFVQTLLSLTQSESLDFIKMHGVPGQALKILLNGIGDHGGWDFRTIDLVTFFDEADESMAKLRAPLLDYLNRLFEVKGVGQKESVQDMAFSFISQPALQQAVGKGKDIPEEPSAEQLRRARHIQKRYATALKILFNGVSGTAPWDSLRRTLTDHLTEQAGQQAQTEAEFQLQLEINRYDWDRNYLQTIGIVQGLMSQSPWEDPDPQTKEPLAPENYEAPVALALSLLLDLWFEKNVTLGGLLKAPEYSIPAEKEFRSRLGAHSPIPWAITLNDTLKRGMQLVEDHVILNLLQNENLIPGEKEALAVLLQYRLKSQRENPWETLEELIPKLGQQRFGAQFAYSQSLTEGGVEPEHRNIKNAVEALVERTKEKLPNASRGLLRDPQLLKTPMGRAEVDRTQGASRKIRIRTHEEYVTMVGVWALAILEGRTPGTRIERVIPQSPEAQKAQDFLRAVEGRTKKGDNRGPLGQFFNDLMEGNLPAPPETLAEFNGRFSRGLPRPTPVETQANDQEKPKQGAPPREEATPEISPPGGNSSPEEVTETANDEEPLTEREPENSNATEEEEGEIPVGETTETEESSPKKRGRFGISFSMPKLLGRKRDKQDEKAKPKTAPPTKSEETTSPEIPGQTSATEEQIPAPTAPTVPEPVLGPPAPGVFFLHSNQSTPNGVGRLPRAEGAAFDTGIYVFLEETQPHNTSFLPSQLIHQLTAFLGQRDSVGIAFDLIAKKWIKEKEKPEVSLDPQIIFQNPDLMEELEGRFQKAIQEENQRRAEIPELDPIEETRSLQEVYEWSQWAISANGLVIGQNNPWDFASQIVVGEILKIREAQASLTVEDILNDPVLYAELTQEFRQELAFQEIADNRGLRQVYNSGKLAMYHMISKRGGRPADLLTTYAETGRSRNFLSLLNRPGYYEGAQEDLPTEVQQPKTARKGLQFGTSVTKTGSNNLFGITLFVFLFAAAPSLWGPPGHFLLEILENLFQMFDIFPTSKDLLLGLPAVIVGKTFIPGQNPERDQDLTDPENAVSLLEKVLPGLFPALATFGLRIHLHTSQTVAEGNLNNLQLAFSLNGEENIDLQGFREEFDWFIRDNYKEVDYRDLVALLAFTTENPTEALMEVFTLLDQKIDRGRRKMGKESSVNDLTSFTEDVGIKTGIGLSQDFWKDNGQGPLQRARERDLALAFLSEFEFVLQGESVDLSIGQRLFQSLLGYITGLKSVEEGQFVATIPFVERRIAETRQQLAHQAIVLDLDQEDGLQTAKRVVSELGQRPPPDITLIFVTPEGEPNLPKGLKTDIPHLVIPSETLTRQMVVEEETMGGEITLKSVDALMEQIQIIAAQGTQEAQVLDTQLFSNNLRMTLLSRTLWHVADPDLEDRLALQIVKLIGQFGFVTTTDTLQKSIETLQETLRHA